MGITTFKTFEDFWTGQTLIHLYDIRGKIGEIWRRPNDSRWTGRLYRSTLRWQRGTEKELIDTINDWLELDQRSGPGGPSPRNEKTPMSAYKTVTLDSLTAIDRLMKARMKERQMPNELPAQIVVQETVIQTTEGVITLTAEDVEVILEGRIREAVDIANRTAMRFDWSGQLPSCIVRWTTQKLIEEEPSDDSEVQEGP